MTEKIIDKVRKLLAVANGTAEGGEHERDTAMRMALGLLAKYNLSMASLEEPKEDRIKDNTLVVHSAPWMRWVGNAVAEMFFCYMYHSTTGRTGNRRRYSFIGLESNVATARAMTEYLIYSIEREGTRRMKEGGHSAAWANSFRKGAAMKIETRCEKFRQEAELASKPVSGERGIVLASLYEQNLADNLRFIEAAGTIITMMDSRVQAPVASGLQAGAEYGEKLNLHKQIGADGKQTDTLRLK